MKVVIALFATLAMSCAAVAQEMPDATNHGAQTRAEWVKFASRLSRPILEPMAQGRLHEELNLEKGTLELSPSWDGRSREVSYMEAFSRLMSGIAPWLALGDDDTEEGRERAAIRDLALKAYANAVDPESPDYLGWTKGSQTLVDAAYLAESFFSRLGCALGAA